MPKSKSLHQRIHELLAEEKKDREKLKMKLEQNEIRSDPLQVVIVDQQEAKNIDAADQIDQEAQEEAIRQAVREKRSFNPFSYEGLSNLWSQLMSESSLDKLIKEEEKGTRNLNEQRLHHNILKSFKPLLRLLKTDKAQTSQSHQRKLLERLDHQASNSGSFRALFRKSKKPPPPAPPPPSLNDEHRTTLNNALPTPRPQPPRPGRRKRPEG